MSSNIVKLAVLLANGASFTDFTQQAFNFIRDPFTTAVANPTDYIYLGRPKPFNQIWVEIKTPNAAGGGLVAQYWNGSAWVNLPLITDDTQAFTRSGFLIWDKVSIQQGSGAWTSTAVNSISKYWIRLQPSLTFNPSPVVMGFGMLFASDMDLKEIQLDILKYLPKDETGAKAASFISSHVAAKEMLLSWLKEGGVKKFSTSDGNYWDVDEWDFHEPEQVRLCAKYLALHLIFKNMIVEKDDLYEKRANTFYQLSKGALSLPLLSLDINGDGIETIDEKNASFKGAFLTR